jgi:hypothetical protein
MPTQAVLNTVSSIPSTPTASILDASAITTIINNLNTLYSSAFTQFLTIFGLLFAIVGLVVPYIAARYQAKSLKAEKETLENKINEEIAIAKKEIRNELLEDINSKIKEAENTSITRMEEKFKALHKKYLCTKAATFFLQARSQLDKKNYSGALTDFSLSVRAYVEGEDEANAQRALRNIIEYCLPNINKEDNFDEKEIEEEIKLLTDFLESKEININNRYANDVILINKAYKEAKKTKNKKDDA